MRYDAELAEVELKSDASEGRYVGVHRFAALEFLARLVDHIPAKGEVRVRDYGAYASRRRDWWRRRGVVLAGAGPESTLDDAEHEVAAWLALKARRRRWAELLRLVFAVDVEVCPDPPSVGTPRRRDAHPRVRDRTRTCLRQVPRWVPVDKTLKRVHEERYEPTHGPLCPVVTEVVGRFLDCGLLEHGFARVRCAACRPHSSLGHLTPNEFARQSQVVRMVQEAACSS